MSKVHDDRREMAEKLIEHEDQLAQHYMEVYWETGSPSSERTAMKHETVADLMRKGLDADRHVAGRARLASYVCMIETQDLIKCAQQVKALQRRVEEGDFV